MKLQLFTVYDSKAQCFFPPFTAVNVPVAERTFAECVNNSEHAFGRNPGDFTLFHLGAFDDAHALFEPVIPPRNVGIAVNYKNVAP